MLLHHGPFPSAFSVLMCVYIGGTAEWDGIAAECATNDGDGHWWQSDPSAAPDIHALGCPARLYVCTVFKGEETHSHISLFAEQQRRIRLNRRLSRAMVLICLQDDIIIWCPFSCRVQKVEIFLYYRSTVFIISIQWYLPRYYSIFSKTAIWREWWLLIYVSLSAVIYTTSRKQPVM